jgi:hypothetical protein
MKKIVCAVAVLFLVVTKVYAYGEGDFQVWHTENQEFAGNGQLRVTAEEEFRFGDSSSDFYYHHYDAGVVYSAGRNIDLGINYRQVYEKKKGKFQEENRTHMNATLKGEILGCMVEDRNRMEFRHFDYQSDSWRYRNKLTVKSPWKLTSLEIRPFVSDEIFMELNDNALDRNRLYLGTTFNLTKQAKAEVYYMLQSSKSSDKWTDANVLGTKLKLIF